MIFRRDANLRGADDSVAEVALAKRAHQRRRAGLPSSLCRGRFTHPHQPTQFDERGSVVVDTCECVLLSRHDGGCVCGHDIERRAYSVDAPGREQ
jgi:hypothetical protein